MTQIYKCKSRFIDRLGIAFLFQCFAVLIQSKKDNLLFVNSWRFKERIIFYDWIIEIQMVNN